MQQGSKVTLSVKGEGHLQAQLQPVLPRGILPPAGPALDAAKSLGPRCRQSIPQAGSCAQKSL